MTTYGLTPTGFVVKPLGQILTDIAAAQAASPALGVDLDTTAESLLGQLNGTVGTPIAELWEVLGILYSARDARAASFDALDAVASSRALCAPWAKGTRRCGFRREAEIATGGTSPVDALRADLLEVAGVVQAVVWENATDAPTADGTPPHSVECLVLGGTDADVGLAIWRGKAAGIQSVGTPPGNTTVTVLDASGAPRVVNFTRPPTVPVYIQIALRSDPRRYVGDAALVAALVAYAGVPLLAGDSVELDTLIVAAKAVPGLTNARITLGTDPSALTDDDVAVDLRQRALLDPSRVAVVPW